MVGNRDAFESDPRYTQRPFIQQQGSFGPYLTQSQASSNHISNYSQAPLSSPSAMQDFNFRFPTSDSNSGSSPFVSPRSQIPAYPQQNTTFQQHLRYPSQGYIQNQISTILPSQAPRLTHPTSAQSQYTSVEQPQNDPVRSYTAIQGPDDPSFMTPGVSSRQSSSRDNYNGFSHQTQNTDQIIRSQHYRQNSYATPLPNLLPPLQSTVTSVPSVMTTTPIYDSYITTDNRTQGQSALQPGSTRSQERYSNYS